MISSLPKSVYRKWGIFIIFFFLLFLKSVVFKNLEILNYKRKKKKGRADVYAVVSLMYGPVAFAF